MRNFFQAVADLCGSEDLDGYWSTYTQWTEELGPRHESAEEALADIVAAQNRGFHTEFPKGPEYDNDGPINFIGYSIKIVTEEDLARQAREREEERQQEEEREANPPKRLASRHSLEALREHFNHH